MTAIASLTLQQNIMDENGHILARLIVDIGLVNLEMGTRQKYRVPAAIKTKFSGLVTSTRR